MTPNDATVSDASIGDLNSDGKMEFLLALHGDPGGAVAVVGEGESREFLRWDAPTGTDGFGREGLRRALWLPALSRPNSPTVLVVEVPELGTQRAGCRVLSDAKLSSTHTPPFPSAERTVCDVVPIDDLDRDGVEDLVVLESSRVRTSEPVDGVLRVVSGGDLGRVLWMANFEAEDGGDAWVVTPVGDVDGDSTTDVGLLRRRVRDGHSAATVFSGRSGRLVGEFTL
ncbi:MAG: hypothetical protein IPJ77_17105 [Planctomycetes bacterium]|nr:hypothetical protein [Planctomycetota bacterium]